jgi:Thiamine pyrophosphate enzyme, N-terminal TPP binding domain
MNGGEAIASILKAEGVEFLLCYPVNHVIEYAARVDIRTIVVRQERVGLHMADAISRLTRARALGVFAMQNGPGTEEGVGGKVSFDRYLGRLRRPGARFGRLWGARNRPLGDRAGNPPGHGANPTRSAGPAGVPHGPGAGDIDVRLTPSCFTRCSPTRLQKWRAANFMSGVIPVWKYRTPRRTNSVICTSSQLNPATFPAATMRSTASRTTSCMIWFFFIAPHVVVTGSFSLNLDLARNFGPLDPRQRVEEIEPEMRRAADARRPIGQLSRPRLGERDQLFHVARRKRRNSP